MAQGILAKQAGGVKTLRGKKGLLLVGKSDPSLATAIPSELVPESLRQFDSQFGWAYLGGLASITLLMRFSIALLLFVAIVLKLDELSIDVAAGRVNGPWLWPVVALIQWELLLSIWLLSGIAQRRAITSALWTFGGFSVYSLGLLSTGASTTRSSKDPCSTIGRHFGTQSFV